MTVRLGKLYRFTASHRLYSPAMSEAQNFATYGKCANPFGHGHNYEVEITVRGPVDEVTGRVADLRSLDELVEGEILTRFDHKDLNAQVPIFRSRVPTTENLTDEAYKYLLAAWDKAFPAGGAALEKVRIWETERNICEVTEPL